MRAYPEVDFRYMIWPQEQLQPRRCKSNPGLHLRSQEQLPGGLSWLDFNNATVTWQVQEAGRKDGKEALKKGPGVVAELPGSSEQIRQ